MLGEDEQGDAPEGLDGHSTYAYGVGLYIGGLDSEVDSAGDRCSSRKSASRNRGKRDKLR